MDGSGAEKEPERLGKARSDMGRLLFTKCQCERPCAETFTLFLLTTSYEVKTLGDDKKRLSKYEKALQ